MEIDIYNLHYIYFVGIKGIAMATLAAYAVGRGIKVYGSDTEEEFPSDEVLNKIGVKPLFGFDGGNVIRNGKPDLVIYTGAHRGRDNPEVVEAIRLGIPVLPHGKALGIFMSSSKGISVAGCHGKTTTTAMIATILTQAGMDPSYAVGSGVVTGLGLPGHAGKGKYFVAEADEYVTDPGHDTTPRFMWQKPEILVVTNIDYDHPDVYSSLSDVQKAYELFSRQVASGGMIISNADDSNSHALNEMKIEHILVGFSPRARIQIRDIHYYGEKTKFELYLDGKKVTDVTLQIPGKHNVVNAAMAAACAWHIGVSWQKIVTGLARFGGAKRRFEKVGKIGNIRIYDDYAHHPSEIEATLSAAREWFPQQRIIAIFQPHTYTRTQALLHEFAESFAHADEVILTDIYASAREVKPKEPVMDDLVRLTGIQVRNLKYLHSYKEVADYLKAHRRKSDVIITLGAGDIYGWGRRLLKDLE